jgi:DNA integrity scanning protein DisA with diadenylate cyclase activity
MTSSFLIEALGWIGAILIVGAYYLNIVGKIKSNSISYILCNLIGGIFFIVHTLVHKAYPSMVINIVWVVIALVALRSKK